MNLLLLRVSLIDEYAKFQLLQRVVFVAVLQAASERKQIKLKLIYFQLHQLFQSKYKYIQQIYRAAQPGWTGLRSNHSKQIQITASVKVIYKCAENGFSLLSQKSPILPLMHDQIVFTKWYLFWALNFF